MGTVLREALVLLTTRRGSRVAPLHLRFICRKSLQTHQLYSRVHTLARTSEVNTHNHVDSGQKADRAGGYLGAGHMPLCVELRPHLLPGPWRLGAWHTRPGPWRPGGARTEAPELRRERGTSREER